MSDRIEKSVVLKAPLQRVWQALTDHRAFGSWFGVRLEGPFVVGRPSAGNITHPGYEHLRWQATVVRLEPQRAFAFRWHPYAIDPSTDYSSEEPTLVTFTLEPAPEGTLLQVIESGFDKVPAHRRDIAFRMNEGGWEQQMKNVAAYLDIEG